MGWLIATLLALVLLGGLVVYARRLGGYRRPADDTLITELLGPPDVPARPAARAGEEPEPSPAPRAQEKPGLPPASQAREEPASQARQEPAPQPPGEAERPPAASAPQAGEGDWLETQLAWIAAWSRRIHHQIQSAGRSEPDREE
jgi:hypothetical protein